MAADLEALRTALRAKFPPIRHAGFAFLDNAGGTLVPLRVAVAVADVLVARGASNSNEENAYGLAQGSILKNAHEATALYFNAPCGGSTVAIGPSSTAMAFRLSTAFALLWGHGDAIVITDLEHDCNAFPWMALERNGVEVRMWKARWPSGLLHLSDLEALLADGKVRFVAMTAASNVVGVLTPYRDATKMVHKANAWICVDWVHLAVHELPDVARDDIDFMLASPYKVFAPHLGCLYIKAELIPVLNPPTLMNFAPSHMKKFEFGTSNFEALAGWIEALRFIMEDIGGAVPGTPLTRAGLEQGYERIVALEAPVRLALIEGLRSIPELEIYGDLHQRVGTVSFTVKGRSSSDLARAICQSGTYVNSGHFHALLPVKALGLSSEGVVRASIAHYNTVAEVEKFVRSLRQIVSTSKL